jgi:nitrite reductase/ring-hydroxylating ferredoxin subunit
MTAPAGPSSLGDVTPAKTPGREVRDGVPLVTWDDATGCRRAALDRCPHRRAPLSAGAVEGGVLRCPYHGWAFAGDGTCVDIPAIGAEGRIPGRARLTTVGPGGRVAPPPPDGDAVAGDDPRLRRFRHPVGLAGDPAPTVVELLGTRTEVDPDRLERALGLWWYAPDGEPVGHLPVVEEDHDDRFVAVHSPPQVWAVEAGAATVGMRRVLRRLLQADRGRPPFREATNPVP